MYGIALLVDFSLSSTVPVSRFSVSHGRSNGFFGGDSGTF